MLRSCRTLTTVIPSRCRSRSRSYISTSWRMSRNAAGSSSSRIDGSCASARARMTRWRSPPLSSVMARRARCAGLGALHRPARRGQIGRAVEAEAADVRRAPEQHHFRHREGEGDHASPAGRHRAAAPARAVRSAPPAALDHHLPPPRAQKAAHQAQQRRLARPVRPDDADELAAGLRRTTRRAPRRRRRSRRSRRAAPAPARSHLPWARLIAATLVG